MTHCTVCGAPAREGAKFCTSCGARLVDTTFPAPAEPAATSEETAVAAAIPVASAEDEQPASEPEAAWAPPASSDQPDAETPAGAEPAPEAPAELAAVAPESGAEAPEYAASWPADDAEPAGEADTAIPEPSWSSWSSEDATTASAPAPESFATDANQDPESSGWQTNTSASFSDDEPASTGTDVDQETRAEVVASADAGEPAERADAGTANAEEGMETSHHGASDWESWAPVASGESTVAPHADHTGEPTAPAQPAHATDVAASVRRLLDDLANRIDRMIAPATLASRDVDADALADQLERWSRPAQGTADLLEVVQAVRKAPRDIDAIGQLADRAADLELLVRHYQAITAGAGAWSRELRVRKTSGSGEA